jgi:hypothetical protein
MLLGSSFVVALRTFKDDVELAAGQHEPGLKRTGRKKGPARIVAARALPLAKLRGKADGFRAVEVDASAGYEVELVAEAPQKGALFLDPPDGHFTTEQDPLVAVDAQDGRIAIDESGQNRKGMALVRQVERDSRASRDLPVRELGRRHRHDESSLQLGDDACDKLALVSARKAPRQGKALEALARGLGFSQRPERVSTERHSEGHHSRNRRIGLHAEHEATGRPVVDRRERQHGLARDLHAGAVESDLGLRERGQHVGHARQRQDFARGKPENAVEPQIVVRGLESCDAASREV